MSTAEWPRPTETLAAAGAKTNRTRRPARKIEAALAAPAPAGVAGFQAMEVHVIDAEKWAVFPVVWWQPELPLAPPKSSGLRTERHHKVPAAGFLNVELAPVSRAGAVATPNGPLAPPQLPQSAPRSDLAPVGWDARSVARKGNGG